MMSGPARIKGFMENFLRKYGWALTLGLIGVGSLLVALTVNNFLAAQLAPYTVPEMPETPQVAARPVQTTATKDWDRAIARLCLFGCPDAPAAQECPGGCPEGQACQAGQCVVVDDAPVASDLPTLSSLNMQLMGTMVASRPEFSLAMIRDDASGNTMIMSVGDVIQGQATITEIRRDRILLERGNQAEYMLLHQTHAGAPSPTPASTRAPARSAPRQLAPNAIKTPRVNNASAAGSQEAVKKVSDTEFVVQRGALNKQIDDPKALAEQGRIAPNFKDGKRDGLKLVGLSPNSVYSQLGIQSGDVLQSLNGKKIDTTSQAMDLFEQFKNSDQVVVEIERRGQKKRMQYKIH